MAKCLEICVEKRKRFVALHKKGVSSIKKLKKGDIPWSTAQSIPKKYKSPGNVLHRCG